MFLKANDKSRFDKYLKKRVVKNQYETMQFPALNIGEMLYISAKSEQVRLMSR